MSLDYILFLPARGTPQVFNDVPFDATLDKVRELLGDITLDHFQGKVNGDIGLFFVDDNGIAKGLPRNDEATLAYHGCCRPGTVACIYGSAVGLFGRYAE